MLPCEMARYIAGFSREARKSGPFPRCWGEHAGEIRRSAVISLGFRGLRRLATIQPTNLDHFDPAIPEPVDSADHLELTLPHGLAQDRGHRTELGNIVDHVLSGRVGKSVTGLTRYRLHRGTDGRDQRGQLSGQCGAVLE